MDAVWAAVLLEALTLCAPMPAVTAEEVRRSIVRTDATVEDAASITRGAGVESAMKVVTSGGGSHVRH